MKVIRCVICDDNEGFCLQLAKLTREAFAYKQVEAEVKVYVDSNKLAEDIRAGEMFHIYLLDIEMPGINGVDLARLIRARYDFRKAVIVFISSHTEYHDELLQLQPYRFLHKLNTSITFLFILEEVADLFVPVPIAFEFAVKKQHYIISYDDIITLESRGRKIRIIYWDRNQPVKAEYYGTLRTELQKLPEQEFCSPHVSYVVNLAHVHNVTPEMIELVTNQTVPIADGKYKETLEKYRLYIKSRPLGFS